MDLISKARRLLRKAFPRPARIMLDDDYPVSGIVTSDKFRDMEMRDRHEMLREALEAKLPEHERKQISIIMAFTPEEGRFKAELDALENGK